MPGLESWPGEMYRLYDALHEDLDWLWHERRRDDLTHLTLPVAAQLRRAGDRPSLRR